jgi:hypothetical protein
VSLYRFTADVGELRAPVLISAFDAWIDAGGAATGAAAHIGRDGVPIISFDTDALLDYRARRPILDVVDGQAKELAWQELTVKLVRAESRDLLVFTGPEPDYRWKEFSASVVELAQRLGIVRSVVLGAIPAAVAHTRPVSLLATASPPDLLGPEDRAPEGLLRVPAAALSVVQMHLAEQGIPTIGFFAQIPHYVTPAYAPGVLALVERVSRHLGLDLPLGTLTEEAQQSRAQLDVIVEGRPEVKEYVERLESLTPEEGLSSGQPIPSGDEIAAEVERFLRKARGDGETRR